MALALDQDPPHGTQQQQLLLVSHGMALAQDQDPSHGTQQQQQLACHGLGLFLDMTTMDQDPIQAMITLAITTMDQALSLVMTTMDQDLSLAKTTPDIAIFSIR